MTTPVRFRDYADDTDLQADLPSWADAEGLDTPPQPSRSGTGLCPVCDCDPWACTCEATS